MKRPRLLVWHGPKDEAALRKAAMAHHPASLHRAAQEADTAPVVDLFSREVIA